MFLTNSLVAAEYDKDWRVFVQTIDKEYPFFELKSIRTDWNKTKRELAKRVDACKSDSEFMGIVSDALDCLRDAHMGIQETKVSLPNPPDKFCLPVAFMPAQDNGVMVMAASPQGATAVLHPGMLIRSINGKPARTVLEAQSDALWKAGGPFSSPQRARILAYRMPLMSDKIDPYKIVYVSDGKEVQLVLKNDSPSRGWVKTYNMPKNLERGEGSSFYSLLPSGVGYIYLRRIQGEQTTAGIQAALKKFPDAYGWIVDLRGNGGGGYGQDLQTVFKGNRKPVAVIIDAGCISAGETYARDLRNMANARLFGSTTAGSSSSKRDWRFPSGIATVRFSTRSRQENGKPIEFNGISPDEVIEPVSKEVLAGQNSEILRAEQYLLKKSGRSPAKK
ncbi:MAG: hypothetical protein LBV12_06170 [Puniceicoccales bacterium]|nr:hypothetical protein [Puniceicoccales bacterium]